MKKIREYVKQNINPLLIGFITGIIFLGAAKMLDNIIIKIALIYK